MELCELTPREWLDREADIVKKLPLTRYRTRPERLVAEPPPRGAPPAAAEDEER